MDSTLDRICYLNLNFINNNYKQKNLIVIAKKRDIEIISKQVFRIIPGLQICDTLRGDVRLEGVQEELVGGYYSVVAAPCHQRA